MRTECIQKVRSRLIVFEEKRSKLTIVNNKGITATRVKVDGCEINEGIRCDYLLIADNVEHFIELKGQDIEHAIKQIQRTIRLLSSDSRSSSKVSFVVCTRSPMTSATIQNYRVNFLREFNSQLHVKGPTFEYHL